MLLTEVIGAEDLVIGSVELTEDLVKSLQPWTIDMIVCVDGCLDDVVECMKKTGMSTTTASRHNVTLDLFPVETFAACYSKTELWIDEHFY